MVVIITGRCGVRDHPVTTRLIILRQTKPTLFVIRVSHGYSVVIMDDD